MESQVAGAIAFVCLCLVLVSAAIWDFRTQKIPNWITYSGILFGLAYWSIADGLSPNGTAIDGLSRAFTAFLVGVLPAGLAFFLKCCGAGDAKLIGAIGALSGSLECLLRSVILGVFFLFIWAIVMMIQKGIVKKTVSRIVGAGLMAAANVKPDLENDVNRIPVAVPIGMGGVIAGAEVLLKVNWPWN